MSQVFISYKSEDRDHALRLAADLTANKFGVWWDENLYGSQFYTIEITNALLAAKAVIVIWTANAVASQWVVGECKKANDAKKLINTSIRGLNTNLIPPPYNVSQLLDLNDRKEIYRAVRILIDRAGPVRPGDIPPEVPALDSLALHLHLKLDIIRQSFKSGPPYIRTAISLVGYNREHFLHRLYLEKTEADWKRTFVDDIEELKNTLSLYPNHCRICDDMIRMIEGWPGSVAKK
jgi:hypothetical protein